MRELGLHRRSESRHRVAVGRGRLERLPELAAEAVAAETSTSSSRGAPRCSGGQNDQRRSHRHGPHQRSGRAGLARLSRGRGQCHRVRDAWTIWPPSGSSHQRDLSRGSSGSAVSRAPTIPLVHYIEGHEGRPRRPSASTPAVCGRKRRTSTSAHSTMRKGTARSDAALARRTVFSPHDALIVELAARHRLPAIYVVDGVRGGRRAHVVRPRLVEILPARRDLRGQDPQGRQARRPARSSSRPSSSWSSTSRPPRPSASRSRRRCWRGRIR